MTTNLQKSQASSLSSNPEEPSELVWKMMIINEKDISMYIHKYDATGWIELNANHTFYLVLQKY
jgi:hypothetical protein